MVRSTSEIEDLKRAQTVGRIGSWRLDPARGQLNWSEETHRIFGLPVGAHLDYESFLAIVHEDDRDFVDASWRRALSGAPYDIEHRIRVGGDIVWVRERAELEFDAEGRAIGAFGTVQDISDRKLAEEDARKAREQLRFITDHAPVMIAHVDADLRYLFVNELYTAMFHKSPEEIVGCYLWEVLGEASFDCVAPMVERTLKGEFVEFDCGMDLSAGKRDLHVSYAPQFDSDRKVIGFLIAVADITERKVAEERLRTFIEEAPVAMAMFDREMNYLGASGRWRDLLHLGEAEIFGRSHLELHPQLSEQYGEAHRRSLAGEVVRNDAGVDIGPDGTRRYSRWELRPWHNSDGSIGGITIAGEDVTARVRQEQALRNRTERLRLALQGANGGVWEWRFVSGKAWWSPEMALLWGFEPNSEVSVEQALARIHPDDRTAIERSLRTAIDTFTDVAEEFRVVNPDRGELWINTFGRVIPGADGKHERLVGLAFDITERKRQMLLIGDLNRRLAAEEARLLAVFEAATNGMAVVDRDGRIRLVNRQIEELFGYSRDELVGQPVEQLLPVDLHQRHESHRGSYFRKPAMRAMGSGLDLTGRRRDGSLVPIEVGLSTVVIDGEEMALANVIDVTAIKRAEQQLKASHAALERVNEDLRQFNHIVSHDLKAPLRGIVQLARFIDEDIAAKRPAEEIRPHAAAISRKAQRLNEMLSALLDFSRIGREERAPETVDVAQLLDEIAEMVPARPGFTIRAGERMPVLETARAPLQLVLLNLVDNASKHNDKPQGWVRIEAVEEADGCRFLVADNGPGIDPQFHETIFLPFSKLADDGDVPGHGMGLALVRRAVESLGGRIGVASSGNGDGTVFEVFWPTRLP